MVQDVLPIVSVVPCKTYDPGVIRQAVDSALAPLGGLDRFVHPGMQVLLKPNLLVASDLEQAITTHPVVVEAVAELVQAAGATVLIGDSPGGSARSEPQVWRKSGMSAVAERTGARLVPFEELVWKRLGTDDYFISRPVVEADLVINLPKLKTHMLTLYSGAVKNLFGTIPGQRKRDIHFRCPGVEDFSRALVDVLELTPPGLTLLDGVLGQEGNGPGVRGTPHRYGCLAASTDPVALDAVITQAMGFRPGEVLHIREAGARGLGTSSVDEIDITDNGANGNPALNFGEVLLPSTHWYFHIPAWATAPLRRVARVRPQVAATACEGCGRCAEVCLCGAITPGQPPTLDLNRCIGCFCCAEICPQGAISLRSNLFARLLGTSRP